MESRRFEMVSRFQIDLPGHSRNQTGSVIISKRARLVHPALFFCVSKEFLKIPLPICIWFIYNIGLWTKSWNKFASFIVQSLAVRNAHNYVCQLKKTFSRVPSRVAVEAISTRKRHDLRGETAFLDAVAKQNYKHQGFQFSKIE
jgi:hypothetical protein